MEEWMEDMFVGFTKQRREVALRGSPREPQSGVVLAKHAEQRIHNDTNRLPLATLINQFCRKGVFSWKCSFNDFRVVRTFEDAVRGWSERCFRSIPSISFLGQEFVVHMNWIPRFDDNKP